MIKRHREKQVRARDREGGTGEGTEMEIWMCVAEGRELCRAQHTVCLQERSADKVVDAWKPGVGETETERGGT